VARTGCGLSSWTLRIPDFNAATLTAFLKQNVAPGSTLSTDGLKSFTRAIGNLQQWLIGTYHGVSRDQLQVYLDEFVFRHNRRRLPMAAFQTLLGLGSGHKPTPYNRIRGAADLSKMPADG
jgi:transposase-like protein